VVLCANWSITARDRVLAGGVPRQLVDNSRA
jgi:hypothetical protein